MEDGSRDQCWVSAALQRTGSGQILRCVISYYHGLTTGPVQTSLDHTGVGLGHRGQCRFVWLIAVWGSGAGRGGGEEGGG